MIMSESRILARSSAAVAPSVLAMAPFSARLRHTAWHPGRSASAHRALRFSFGCSRKGTGDVDAAARTRSQLETSRAGQPWGLATSTASK